MSRSHGQKNQHSLNDYKYYGKWVGNATLDENCTNPEVLYESIVAKPEDVFYYIRYVYFDGSEIREKATSKSSKFRSYVDSDYKGRCYMFNPTKKIIKSGIKMINVQLWKSSDFYFHTRGMFKIKILNIPGFHT